MDVDPHRGVLVPEVVRKLGIGHQVKPHQLHRSIPPRREWRRLTGSTVRVKAQPNARLVIGADRRTVTLDKLAE
jgi:hypothetical protein